MEFKSATNNLGLTYRPTDTFQVETVDENGDTKLENTYIVEISSVDIIEDDLNDEGRVEEATAYVSVQPSEMGRIILEADSYESAADTLNDEGYTHKDGRIDAETVEELDDELDELHFECKKGDVVGFNQQNLEAHGDEGQVFSVKLDTFTETSTPLMAGFKIGANSVEFTLVETLTEATEDVNSVAFGDGFLAYGSDDDNVYVHDTSDFSLETTLTEATDRVFEVAFGDGFIAYGSDDENVYVHDTSDFSLETTLTEATNTVRSVAFGDGFIAYGSWDDNLYVHDATDFSLETTLTEATDRVYGVTFSDGFIAYASWDENVYVHDTSDFGLEQTLTEATDRVVSVAFGDGFIAYGSWDDNLYVHDATDFGLETTLTEATDRVQSVAFGDGFLAYGSDDDNVYVHDTSDFSLETTLTEATNGVNKVAFSDEFLAYGSGDDNVYVHETGPGLNIEVETQAATNIDFFSATLNGEVTEIEGFEDADVFFEYGETVEELDTAPQTITEPQTFDESVDELVNDTQHEFRAVALGDGDPEERFEGDILTFTTDNATVDLQTDEATGVDSFEAVLNGEVLDIIGYDEADVFFQYGDTDVTDNETAPNTISTPQTFDELIESLSAGATYEFRAMANATGTVEDTFEGDTLTFTTLEVEVDGQITLNEEAVEGADVIAYNLTTDEFISSTVTDAEGEYVIEAPRVSEGDIVAVAVDFQGENENYGRLVSTVI